MFASLRVSFVVCALLITGQASAASVSYYLDQSNDLADGINYAKVTIADGVGGDIDFTVEIIESAFPSPFSNFGMQAFFFNYDKDAVPPLQISAGNIVNVNPTEWNIIEDKNAGGGFGSFEFEAMGDGSSRTSLLTFSISGVDNDTIASYAVGNADGMGEFFAAHIAGYDGSVTGNTSGKFAGSTVPVPAAVWLFGSALGMLGWVRRRKSAAQS